MSEVVMAILKIHGALRQTCVGCSDVLYDLGMLEIVKEMPFSDRRPEFVTRFYAIAPGYTLADCREAVKERHVKPPEWGG